MSRYDIELVIPSRLKHRPLKASDPDGFYVSSGGDLVLKSESKVLFLERLDSFIFTEWTPTEELTSHYRPLAVGETVTITRND